MPLIVIFGVGIVWSQGHEHIARAYGYARYVEFSFFYVVGEVVDGLPVFGFLHDLVSSVCNPEEVLGACTLNFKGVTWAAIRDTSMAPNIAFIVLTAAWCLRLFIRATNEHPLFRFSRNHSMTSFIREVMEARDKSGKALYPHLGVFGKLPQVLIDAELDDPVFGMSETSQSFSKKHGLIASWEPASGGAFLPKLDEEKCQVVFCAQLGSQTDLELSSLGDSELLLYSIVLPRVAACNSELPDDVFKTYMADSRRMMEFCWAQFKPSVHPNDQAWMRPTIDMTEPRKVIQQYVSDPRIKHLITRHAYNRTLLFSLFGEARKLGVLPPADVRWLRFYDRGLWYVVQNIGRQGVFVEAAGVYAHYLMEKRLDKPLQSPHVERAVKGLGMALRSFRFESEKL